MRVERLLNDFTCEAEAWAAAGTRKAGEVVILRGHARCRLPARRIELRNNAGHGILAPRERPANRLGVMRIPWYLNGAFERMFMRCR